MNVYSKPTAPYAQMHWIGYMEFIFVQTEQSPNKQTFSFPQMRKLHVNLLTTVLKMTNTIIDKSKPFNMEKSTDPRLLIVSTCNSILEVLPNP